MADLVLEPSQAALAATNPPANAGHPWNEVLRRLQEARPFLDQYDPDLAKRIEKLSDRVQEHSSPFADAWIKTQAAYIVADIDRHTGAALTLPPALREEVDRLAVSSPGLRHADLAALLRQTPDLSASDKALIQDIRYQARAYVTGGAEANEQGFKSRIEQLQSRVQVRLAGPEPPPIAATPPSPAPAQNSAPPAPKSEPTPAQPQQGPAGAQPQPQSGRSPLSLGEAVHVPQQVPTSRLGSRIASIVSALAPPRPQGEAPWAATQTDLSARYDNYAAARADQRSQALQANLDATAQSIMRALSTLSAGPAKEIMSKIEQAANNDPNGFRGVIASMHPGGRNESLRDEYNAVLAQHPSFSADLKRTGAGMESYAAARGAVVADYEKRGWDTTGLDARLRAFDQTIADGAQRIPGRESGKALYEELSERAAKAVEALIEKVKSFFRNDADPSAKPTPAAAPRQGMAPAP